MKQQDRQASMARARKHEEHENHERWLVSYADFITLLFAFFVVMYSISSVNEGKYRVLSDSLVASFKSTAKSLKPIQVGRLVRSPAVTSVSMRNIPVVIKLPEMPAPRQEIQKKAVNKGGQEKNRELGKIGDEIQKAMAPLINKGLIKIRRNKFWIEVDIRSNILFFSGRAQLSRAAIPVLEKLAQILKPHSNIIHVEGFTDNVPINTEAFPSNWELSAARAASVVHLFTSAGLDPRRLVALGYAEYRPIASNDTEEGRRKNRRVVLVIKADKKSAGMLRGLQGIEGKSGAEKAPATPARPKKQKEQVISPGILLPPNHRPATTGTGAP
jgi:chemotaxis protein MotB